MGSRKERRQAILRTRRNASFRLMVRRRAEFKTARDLGQITGEVWETLDGREQMRHRQVVIDIEDNWDRWPKSFAYPVLGGAFFAFWAMLLWLICWLDD